MVIYGPGAIQSIQNRVMNATDFFFRGKTVSTLWVVWSLEICECDYCGSFIHEECIRVSKFHCKQLTSSKPRIKHLWYSLLLYLSSAGWKGTLILEQPVVFVMKKLLALLIYLENVVSGVNELFTSMCMEYNWVVVNVSQSWANIVILVDMSPS